MASETLKRRLTHPPVLPIAGFEDHYHVETDACSVAVAAVLSQKKADGNMQPVHCASHTMNSAKQSYSTCK